MKIRKSRGRFALLIVGLGVGLVVLLLVSMGVGAKQIPLAVILRAFFQYEPTNGQHIIVQTLRFPRTLAAAAVGASLAVSGALMQAMTRNPMASPSVLGINAGAGLGLAVAVALVPAATFSQTVLFSFAGAGVAAVTIFGIASIGRAGSSPVRLALAGTAVTALFSAVSQAIAMYFRIAQELTFWNAGGVSGVRPEQVRLLFPWTIAGLLLALFLARPVSLLSLGEEVAVGLGGKLIYIKIAACVAVLVLTGSAVAIAGPISFVGLVAPHAIKFLVGSDYKKIVPCSILGGAVLVLGADILARLVNPPFETPTGAVTALIGVPFFIYLATKKEVRG